MPTVYVSVGSNINPADNIRSAMQALKSHYGQVISSPVYENAPVGFDGDNFYNLVVAFETEDEVQNVAQILRDIETAHGRTRQETKFSSRTLDLDMLLYGDLVQQGDFFSVPRDEITRYAFVLKPLADVAAELIHPILQQPVSDIWREFAADDQTTLTVVSLSI